MTGFVELSSMLYLMLSSTQLFQESLKTSQETLFSQAFNHPSSVIAAALYLIHTQVRYQKQKDIFLSPSLFKRMLHFVFTVEFL